MHSWRISSPCQQLPPRLAERLQYDRTPFKAPGSATTSATATPGSAASSSTSACSGGGGRVRRGGRGCKSAETLAKEKAALAAFLVRKYMAKRASWRERRAPPPTNYEAEVEYLGEKTREERDAEGREAAVELEHE